VGSSNTPGALAVVAAVNDASTVVVQTGHCRVIVTGHLQCGQILR
jgi:hypothetical protein